MGSRRILLVGSLALGLGALAVAFRPVIAEVERAAEADRYRRHASS